MKENDNIIDYGNFNVPTSWNELDLKRFSRIEEYYSEKEDKNFDIREVLSILCDKTQDEINELPEEFTEKILEKLSWISTEPPKCPPTNVIEIDGERYLVNTREKLKTGEFIAADTILKNDKHNYAALMAVLCRKENEKYDSYFENEVVPSRIEMFEKVSVMKILPIISFFLSCCLISKMHSQLCLEAEDALSLIQKNIEISRRNGHLSAFSTILLKRKLKKLKKSMRAIYQTSSN